MKISRSPRRGRGGQAGFTLVEMAVALGVTVIVMLGILFLFDFNNRLTRVQTNVADMQQSLRIGQYDLVRQVRMAGRGGLAAGQGVVVRRDVADDAHLIDGDTDSPPVVKDTDVLTVRGVFSSPIYQISFTNPLAYVAPDTTTGLGETEICRISPSGSVQDLGPLETLAARSTLYPEALVFVSPIGDQFYAVVRLESIDKDPSSSTCPSVASGTRSVKLGFKANVAAVASYTALGAAPEFADIALSKTAYIGILEEYRYYIRESHEIEDDEDSAVIPILSRARFYPGTDTVYDTLQDDIADGILDLQIALGFDVDGDGTVAEDLDEPDMDEWLGNAPGEAAITGGLKAVRISTLARTMRADPQYTADVVNQIEDHVYPLDQTDPINTEKARRYRRRVMQTIVNLRNLTT